MRSVPNFSWIPDLNHTLISSSINCSVQMFMVLLFAVLQNPAAGENPLPTNGLEADVPETSRGLPAFDRTWKQYRSAEASAPSSSGSTGDSRTKQTENSHKLPRWSVFVYGGKWSDNRFVQILGGSTKLRSSYLWAIGVSRTMTQLYRYLVLEGEANFAVHTGIQDHLEFNLSPNLRWTKMPWDPLVDSTIAFGLGGSAATEKPPVEVRSEEEDPSKYLFFMMGEVTFEFVQSDSTSWEGFLRIHHRSGGFETVIDAEGSNFISLGVRYRFGNQ